MSRSMFLAPCLAMVWIGAAPALAGPAEAEQTAREIEAALDHLGGDAFRVERRGSVRAGEQPDGRYLAHLPPLAVVDRQGGRARIDGASVKVKLLDRRQRQIELTLPARIPLLDAKGVETYRLEPGRQRFLALWLPAVNNRLDRVDAGYTGLRLLQAGIPAPMLAGDLTIKPAEGGKSQLTFRLTVDPLPPHDPATAVTAKLDGRGQLGPALASPYGTAGRLDVVADGLDGLVRHLSAKGRDPTALNAFASATILRSLGKPRQRGEGDKVHDYRLDLGPEGQFLVNGVDLSALGQLFKKP